MTMGRLLVTGADGMVGGYVPEVFKEVDDHSVVIRQPEGEDEITRCLESLEDCPVQSIGEDG